MAISYFCPHCGAENAPDDTLCHACQHPLDTLPNVQESTTLLNERYQVLAEVGAGGFGAVYKALDTREQGRLVAVKQINLKGLSSQEIIEATDAFNREAQILSDLSHPLLPHIFDRFSDPEHWYLVMNFIDGSTLDEYLQQQVVHVLPAHSGLSLEETLTIGLQLCDALHYLHSQQPPVIFRDLKPGNIMRTTVGRLYLIDFGIARRFKPGQAKDTIPFGSPGYAAPEQYGKAQTTPQADIYSLGALLFCLISGDDPSEHPFQFPPLRLYGIDGISELDALIQRMVALDPTQRPADIQEVQAELQHIQRLHARSNKQPHIWIPPQGQTPPTTLATTSGGQQQIFLTPSGTQSPARKTSRRRVLTVGLLAGGAALVGGIMFLGNQRPQPLPAQSQPGNQSAFDAGATAGAATVDAQNGQATATETSQKAAVPLNGPTFWSPDLSHAAVINLQQDQLEIYLVQSQKLLHTIKKSADIASDDFANATIQWSPDNSKIFLYAGPIEAWDIQNGRKLFTFTSAGYISDPMVSFSPDGQYWAIGYQDEDSLDSTFFTLLRTRDGKQLFQKRVPNFSYQNTLSNLAWSSDSKYIAFPAASEWLDGQPWSAAVWSVETYQKVGSFGGVLPPPADKFYSTYDILAIAWSSSGKIATIINDGIWLNYFGTAQPASILTTISYDTIDSSPVWSPDSKYLAILLDQNLDIWDTTSGQSIQGGHQGNTAAFAWAADSKSITVVDNNNVISHWSVG